MSRKRFNIGLVGSVSNGKTTLVERLSSVNTKRHSSEMKEGRTVKLGYANLLMWKCFICNTIYTTGQKVSKKECEDCNNPCTVEFELSLVDAPGHSAFIKTMIRLGVHNNPYLMDLFLLVFFQTFFNLDSKVENKNQPLLFNEMFNG